MARRALRLALVPPSMEHDLSKQTLRWKPEVAFGRWRLQSNSGRGVWYDTEITVTDSITTCSNIKIENRIVGIAPTIDMAKSMAYAIYGSDGTNEGIVEAIRKFWQGELSHARYLVNQYATDIEKTSTKLLQANQKVALIDDWKSCDTD
jgi:hypothetical protein